MKLTTKEFKELYEWSNAFEELIQMNKSIKKSLDEVEKIDGLMSSLECANNECDSLDEERAYEKLESHFKEKIQKANDYVRECEHMLGVIKILKNGADEIAECDGKIASCVTEIKPRKKEWEQVCVLLDEANKLE